MQHQKTLICRQFWLIAFFILSVASVHAQQAARQPLVNVQNEAAIQNIRRTYQQINALNLTAERFKYESSGCVQDGVVTYFFSGKKILKIVESGSIGDGSWVHEFYYDAGKLIFCLESLVGGPANGPVTKTQYRVYLKQGSVIRALHDSNKISATDSKATELMQAGTRIYAAYTTKDFVSALCN
ncbi:hypothetical protein [Pedobacter sp. SYP-B3415]|uniref:hypothetical protein n=1 Tax=Pedobacter sp. SYP-B3415 TaxID=2496641 RepID=UPI00101D4442|nr:hypothetical protein [Pedobacter sp. SYP-B3415]